MAPFILSAKSNIWHICGVKHFIFARRKFCEFSDSGHFGTPLDHPNHEFARKLSASEILVFYSILIQVAEYFLRQTVSCFWLLYFWNYNITYWLLQRFFSNIDTACWMQVAYIPMYRLSIHQNVWGSYSCMVPCMSWVTISHVLGIFQCNEVCIASSQIWLT